MAFIMASHRPTGQNLRAKKKRPVVSQKKLTHARQRENGRPSDSRARRGVEWRRGVEGAAFNVGVGGGATKSTDFVETQPDTGCDTLKRAVPFAAVPSPVIVRAVPGGQVATSGESSSTPSLTIAPPATRAGTM